MKTTILVGVVVGIWGSCYIVGGHYWVDNAVSQTTGAVCMYLAAKLQEENWT